MVASDSHVEQGSVSRKQNSGEDGEGLKSLLHLFKTKGEVGRGYETVRKKTQKGV